MKSTRSYQDHLIESLKSSKEAAAYLTAAFEDGDPSVFLLAVKNVVEARGGVSKLAKSSRLNRTNLYRMLSEDGNPEFGSLLALIKSLGLKLSVEPVPYKKASGM